jgi:hypothetical protein
MDGIGAIFPSATAPLSITPDASPGRCRAQPADVPAEQPIPEDKSERSRMGSERYSHPQQPRCRSRRMLRPGDAVPSQRMSRPNSRYRRTSLSAHGWDRSDIPIRNSPAVDHAGCFARAMPCPASGCPGQTPGTGGKVGAPHTGIGVISTCLDRAGERFGRPERAGGFMNSRFQGGCLFCDFIICFYAAKPPTPPPETSFRHRLPPTVTPTPDRLRPIRP